MTTTKREEMAQRLYERLQAVPGLQALGLAFSRSLFAALDMRGKKRVLVVHHGKEQLGAESTAEIDRHAVLIVTIVTRDPDPDSLSEAAFALMHPAVMTFTDPALIDISELGTDAPSYDNLGGIVGARAVHYDFFYRTGRDSLSA
ncbi:hypothetical protein [Cupriavidus basilensis]|uniref:hypothetical protein n=1 Tax=Cupriavidus basilensis TaxID=68895 RepID=UPI0007518A96|nr:hypothetical protein [Cupriavidus basilensis]